MKVVEVITHLDVGGAQATLVSLAKFIDHDEFELTIVAGTRDGGPGELVPELEALGAQVIVVPSLRRAVSLRDARAFVELVRVFRRLRPDAVHTHSSKAGVLGRIAARVARVPSVVHTAHSWSFHARGSLVVARVCVVLERALGRLTDVIVVVADADRRTGEAHGVRPRRAYELIRSGVDLRAYPARDEAARRAARAELGVPADVPLIGTVSRLAAPKDPETFVRAVAHVADALPDCRAIVIGDGPLRTVAEKCAADLGVRDRVAFVGARRDVARLLPAFDVFGLSSRWEALPRVLVEAMSVGIPVVATDVNGIGEIVIDGETGELAPPGDADRFGAACSLILRDGERARGYAATAWARLSEFDATTMAARHGAVYRALAGRDRKCRVVHIATGLGVGGAENVLAALLDAGDRDGFESHVISLGDIGPVGDRIRAAGTPVEAVGMAPGRVDIRRVWHLQRRLRKLRPDVVVTWMYHADLVGGVAARLAGARTIVWNLRIAEPTPDQMNSRTGLVVRACALLSRIVPTEIVTVAESGVEGHRALNYDMRGARVIGNGVDVERFRPDPRAGASLREELGVPAEVPLVSYVARFDPQKDHATFVAAAAVIAEARPDVRFALCGANCSPENAALVALCRGGGILDRVLLLGVRPDIEVVFAASDAAVSSSRMEGFPNAIAEAMACGCCVVATDVGDTRRVIGHAGRIVPPVDARALASAVLQILNLPADTRRALGCAAQARIAEEFTLSRSVAAYEELYSCASLARGR